MTVENATSSGDMENRDCQGCGTPMKDKGDGDHTWWSCPSCDYERGEFVGS